MVSGRDCACLVIVKALQELRILQTYFPVDTQTQVDPAADPVALVEIRCGSFPVIDIGLVVTAACTYRPHPARVAIGPGTDMMLIEKVTTGLVIETSGRDVAHLRDRRIDKSVARRDVA